jgi:TrpR-related protein YerC/YecD
MSSHPLTPSQREHVYDLINTMLDIHDPAQIHVLLADLCGNKELASFADRWAIAKFLQMGFSYRTVMRKTGASSATIGRVARILAHGRGALNSACVRREQLCARVRFDLSLPPSGFRFSSN